MFHNSNTQYRQPVSTKPEEPPFSLRDKLVSMGVSNVSAHLAFVAEHRALINPRNYPEGYAG